MLPSRTSRARGSSWWTPRPPCGSTRPETLSLCSRQLEAQSFSRTAIIVSLCLRVTRSATHPPSLLCATSNLSHIFIQLRVHETRGSQIYLHVTSKPIIEDCSELGFAPYINTEPEVLAQFGEAGLDVTANFWDQVEDFKWLKQTKSPNWEILPVERRETPWK